MSRRTFVSFAALGTSALSAACGGGAAQASTAAVTDAPGPSLPPAPTPTAAMPPAPAPAPAPAPIETSDAPLADAPSQPDSASGTGSASWDLGSTLSMVAGAGARVDLNTTLPEGVRRGGSFTVDPTGAALPSGAALTGDGVLTVAASAHAGLTAGVVFAYVVD